LSPQLREQIALAVAQENDCDYCLAAHTALGRSVGLSDEAIRDSRRGASPDSKTDAALRFARLIVEKRGRVSDEDVARVRYAGHTDAEIAEIVANVAVNIFTNYFNHVAETEVDFPPAQRARAA
jgi:AhpD family alkylhydroperoxidase